MKSPSFWKTTRIELFSFVTLFWSILLGTLYLFLIQLLLNYRLIAASFADQFSFSTRFSLLFSLFLGSFTSMAGELIPFIILLLNALFVGLTIVLLIKSIGLLTQGKVHVALGGATIFSLVTAGCASCGLSIISVLGLSATLSFLPFHGTELRIISLILLLVSAFYMLKKLHEAKYCRI